jgi:hypothetical protein
VTNAKFEVGELTFNSLLRDQSVKYRTRTRLKFSNFQFSLARSVQAGML